MKPKRIVDEALLDQVRALPCLACASRDPHGARSAIGEDWVRSHAHHVISRGAGGGDVPENVMPLCVEHHNQWHLYGKPYMRKEFAVIDVWMEIAGHGRAEG